MDLICLHDPPTSVWSFVENHPKGAACERNGQRWSNSSLDATFTTENATAIRVHSPKAPLGRIAIRWGMDVPETSLILSDAWERSYGDLLWRPIQPERILPWYFAIHDTASKKSAAAGVKTQPAAMCFWTVDAAGITLWLDCRNGGMPSVPGDRVIEAATIVTQPESDDSAMSVIRKLCVAMCDKPRLAPNPICGNNNWYYAYGENFDADQVKRDAALLAELAGDHVNRPYCVIDAGWSPGGVAVGGPWTAGLPDKFPNMPNLAEQIVKIGVQPGIWIRPTALSLNIDARRLRPGLQGAPEKALDLTLPENLQNIHDDIHRMHVWGYRLIKHDFSTFDMFGRWGFEMGAELTESNWHFVDRSLTNAEILLRLYRTIRDAAGDSTLIGCNTVGHIGAGLFELQRTGDDTSGRAWERTRRMGVNTLAYRLPQNGTFFTMDADCVAHTEYTPWEKDRQWLDLVSRSGSALFVSADPTKIAPEVKTEMSAAVRRALTTTPHDVEPLDWLSNTTPSRWRFGDQTVQYDWLAPTGAWPLRS